MSSQAKRWSEPKHARYLGPHTDESIHEITLVLRRRGTAPLSATWGSVEPVAHEEFGEHFGAHPDDVERLRGFAAAHGLEETDFHGHRRVIHFRGPTSAMRLAFGVDFHRYHCERTDKEFVATADAPALPEGVIAVLGLDRRPVAHPYFHKSQAHAPGSFGFGDSSLQNTYTPVQLGKIYNFPEADGTGECLAIIELGGGFEDNNLVEYFHSIGVKAPSVESISVLGAENAIGTDADGEVQLDIEVAGALIPEARIAVYFCTNTDQGFHEAISMAAHDAERKPSVISISWGGPEDHWSDQAIASIQSALEDAAALGVSITVASGDNGANDGISDGHLRADFPASSPSVLACGGTKLIASGTHISQESVWNEGSDGASGGGVSTYFPLPAWQKDSKVPQAANGFVGRGVPDVAGVADPVTGYQVRVNHEDQVVGGTSAVAPLWAALLIRYNQLLKASVGDIFSVIYGLPGTTFHDITHGNNAGYSAGLGWDACTGLGTPDGSALLTALEQLKTANKPF